MRRRIHINYDWKYKNDFQEAYIDPAFDDASFETVLLPHTNIELPYNNFAEEVYQFVSTYRKKIWIDVSQRGKRALLTFEGVMTYAKVYLNGHYVCDHKGGYLPFVCDLTPYIGFDMDNVLVVIVDSTEREDIPPFGYVIDYLTYGGIYREVSLEWVHDLYVDNMFVKTRDVLTETKWLDIDVYLENKAGDSGVVLLEFQLLKEGKSMHAWSGPSYLTKETKQKINVRQPISDVQLWHIQEPHLYELLVKVNQHEKVVDEYQVRFGFREVEFQSEGFYLNGCKLKLRGLNRHQSFPYVGYAMPKSAQVQDAEILKYELGVNIVRLSHYPQSRHFLDRCDELGLLVFDEIPGWQHIGNEEWRQNAIRHVEEMIKKDWNRPSIIIWGVRINESQDNHNFYTETNRVAKALDDTRQTGGVRNFEGSELLEDVYTYNDFIHRGNNAALHNPRDVVKNKVPYLVTEHNGHMFPTKKFDNESKRVEQALRHLRVLDYMYGDPGIAGAIGWCAFDYNTHKDFGSGDRICYHGVMDMFRIAKDAAYMYASQQDDKPVLEVAASMNMGEREAAELDAVYVFTNCDYIKLYKNGEFIGTYFPSKDAFPNMPNPPIVITDFIGNLIEKNENFTKNDAQAIKDILYAIVKYGNKSLPWKYKIKMGWLMYKYKMSYEKAVTLYETYIANWGMKSLTYSFEGYKNDELVMIVQKGPTSSKNITIKPDKLKLTEEETYDVCRVVVKHVDEFDHALPYSNDVVTVEIEGPGEIIGPKQLALTGGSTAFWVKSIGKTGVIYVTVHSNRYEPKIVELQVER